MSATLSPCWQPRSAEHLSALERLQSLTQQIGHLLTDQTTRPTDDATVDAWEEALDLVARLARQPRDPWAPQLDADEARVLFDAADRAALIFAALKAVNRARGVASRRAASVLLHRRLTMPLESCG